MADIFISYSQKDLSRVRTLAAALSARGWSVWWDRQIPAGRMFDQAIAEALESARCVVVVWSKESITSSWVREEAEEGRRREILIPVRLDDGRPPLGFGRIQAVDLSDWNGADTADAFQKLVTDIASILGPAPAHESVRTHGSFRWRGEAVRWSLTAVLVLSLLAVGLYRLRMDDVGSKQPPPSGTAAQSGLRLSAVMTEGGEPLPTGVSYSVYEAAKDLDGHRKAVVGSSGEQGPPRFTLPAGRYYVAAAYGNASAGAEVDIATGEIKPQILNLRAGILNLSSVLAAGSPLLTTGLSYEVYEAGTDIEGKRKRVSGSPGHEGPSRFALPAGRYYVTAVYGNASASSELDITAGEITAHTLNLRAGFLNLSSVLTNGSPPLTTELSYEVYEAARDVEGKRKRVSGSRGHEGPSRFVLPAGRYYVTAASDAGRGDAEIAVSEGKVHQVRVRLSRAE